MKQKNVTLLIQTDLVITTEVSYLLNLAHTITPTRRTIPERKNSMEMVSVRGLVELICALHQAECLGEKKEIYPT